MIQYLKAFEPQELGRISIFFGIHTSNVVKMARRRNMGKPCCDMCHTMNIAEFSKKR